MYKSSYMFLLSSLILAQYIYFIKGKSYVIDGLPAGIDTNAKWTKTPPQLFTQATTWPFSLQQ